MATVTLPTPIFSGTASSDSWKDFFVVVPDTGSNTTLGVINGDLEYDNLASGVNIERDHCQPRSNIKVQICSGSLNLDYFADVWGPDTDEEDVLLRGEPVPGLSCSFYVPYDTADVVVMPQWLWMASLKQFEGRDPAWSCYMTLNGSSVGPPTRRMHRNVDSNGDHSGVQSLRANAPHHYFSQLTRGYYTVAMNVSPSATVTNDLVRFWNRNVIVMMFKR